MATITFNLHQPFKKGETTKIRELRAKKESILSLLNPLETRVYLYLTEDRSHVIRIKTDEKMLAKYWDFTYNKTKPSYPDTVAFNQRLENLKNLVSKSYRELKDDNLSFNEIGVALKYLVKNGQMQVVNDKKNLSFDEVFKQYLEIKGKSLDRKTVQKFETLGKILADYQTKKKVQIQFRNLDLVFYQKFKNYLLFDRINYVTGKPGLLNDTIEKYLKAFKNFLTWSFDGGYHNNELHLKSGFKTSIKSKDEATEKKNIITLLEPEIKLLHEIDLTKKHHLDKTRDIFLFLIYTAQRWSDVYGFKKSDVKNGSWTFTTVKTDQEITVPLTGFASPAYQILMKYDFDLPKLNEQVFNRQIKKVGKLAKIDTPTKKVRYTGGIKIETLKPKHDFLSSHCGRRTGITLLLERNVPIVLVQLLTGHKDLKTLQKYINPDKDKLRQAFNDVGNVIESPQMKIAN